jgi:hypothetical protein
MTTPLPPLFSDDIARQSLMNEGFAALQAAVAALSRKVDDLMSQDASTAAAAARIEADEQDVLAALRSQQALITALQAEVAAGHLSQATVDALNQAQADMDKLRTEADADVAANAPPSAAPPAG